MSRQRFMPRSKWIWLELAVAIVCVAAASYTFYYRSYVDPIPSDEGLWEAVLEAYPDGGLDCHVSTMDRVLRVSDMLRDSPYVDDAPFFSFQPIRQADEMALDMVLGRGAEVPPECGGTADGEDGVMQRHSMDAAQMGAKSP